MPVVVKKPAATQSSGKAPKVRKANFKKPSADTVAPNVRKANIKKPSADTDAPHAPPVPPLVELKRLAPNTDVSKNVRKFLMTGIIYHPDVFVSKPIELIERNRFQRAADVASEKCGQSGMRPESCGYYTLSLIRSTLTKVEFRMITRWHTSPGHLGAWMKHDNAQGVEQLYFWIPDHQMRRRCEESCAVPIEHLPLATSYASLQVHWDDKRQLTT